LGTSSHLPHANSWPFKSTRRKCAQRQHHDRLSKKLLLDAHDEDEGDDGILDGRIAIYQSLILVQSSRIHRHLSSCT